MPNALQHETSPYLLQHADNPVDWLPWGPEALDLARKDNKPILLSIGYSACHWCHVMAHESFEDEATAELMNRLFVNIKVDREERPDLDRIYQATQQLFTGRAGGWPLTVFLTPEQWPITAGTYFPKTAGYGLPAFSEVLTRVADYFRDHRPEIDQNARRLLDALNQAPAESYAGPPTGRLAEAARTRLADAFDASKGGFGRAPRFPHPAEVGMLLSLFRDDAGSRQIVEGILGAMASGGLFDHLAGGFFRYCVDADWQIPHFEKMLYDNAALVGLYSEAAAATGSQLFANAAQASAEWVLKEMRDPAGAFYATLDADSEGEEGKFYTFVREDFERALEPEESAAAIAYYGLDQPPNFEGKAWHLQPRDRAVPHAAADALVESARAKLLALREERERPGRDEKILTGWNGLMIGSLAKAARYLNQPELGQAAQAAADFLRSHLWQDGCLNASYKDGRARFSAYLDDYAFLAFGLTELLQWQFRSGDLEFATALADGIIEHFRDPAGGFFFTADDHEELIHRPKPLADESVPSGNGMAALALDTLGHLLGEGRYLTAAAKTVHAALPNIARHPEAHASFLKVIDRLEEPPEIVIVRGTDSSLEEWRKRIDTGFNPGRLFFFIPNETGDLPGVLNTREASDRTTGYLCRGVECLAPMQDLDEFAARLGDPGVNKPRDDRPSPD